MRMVYKVLAFAVAALVMVQAAAIAFGVFGLVVWIDGGGTLDAATAESDLTFPGVAGFMIHGMFGMIVIPIVAILLLITSFFAHTPGAVKWALIVVGTTVIQVGLGLAGHGVPHLGILHGITAMVLFGVAIMAGMRVKKPVTRGEPAAAQPIAPAATA